MKKLFPFALAFLGLMLMASTGMAQEDAKKVVPLIDFTKYFGAGLVTCGAAYGISKLASSALESMARQPEVAGTIQVAMIIAAALIEGFTFFAIYVCMTQNPWK